jgi:type IV pilus assembly protein PilB
MDPAQVSALKLVPENLATVYRVLPLRYEADILTIALAATNEWVANELKIFLGVERVDHLVWPLEEIERGIAKCYSAPQ